MKIDKHLSLLLMAALIAGPAAAQRTKTAKAHRRVGKPMAAVQKAASDGTAQVFLYSPGHDKGMRMAYADSTRQMVDLAQIFSSDYAQWGAEKRMYAPFVTALEEGGYAAVFQVNDYSPCFAVAYSDDLMTWRPQDYPRMTEGGCYAPVIVREGNGRYAVLFKNKRGEVRRSLTDASFRHFTPDMAGSLSDYEQANRRRDTLTVGGREFVGNQVSTKRLADIRAYYDLQAANARRWTETLAGDKKKFASLVTSVDGSKDKALAVRLDIHAAQQKKISDKLVGIFFEDISYAADGGLYAEMVQNRDFEYTAADRKGWNATTAWRSRRLEIDDRYPLSENNPHYLVMDTDTLYNSGWDGMHVDKGASYDFSIRCNLLEKKSKQLTVAIVDKNGNVVAQTLLKAKAAGKPQGDRGYGWQQLTATLTASVTADGAELMIVPSGKGRMAVDMVSLFPQDTFKGRRNGLRRDLAQALADLHPKFVRFPGGCMSHGNGIDNIYHWQHSIGKLEDRKPDHNCWHYHQTRGLGFYEYFQFCEDIGAEPLPVLAAGVPCQNSQRDKDGYGGQQGGIPMADMPAYIQELLDLIEWANGDPATSRWAKMRAEAGHPEPFHLKYIGIGNEDIISTVFEERCLMICRAIREKYPDITICGTVGPFHHPSSDYVEGWKFANAHKDVIDMVDEHYYESVGWFLNNQHYYDNYDRKAPKVYLGEWAARVGKGNLDCALAEALHLCGLERNADVVEMSSYAPLFCHEKHQNWNPDMMYFNATQIDKTPSYYTQQLFSKTSGDYYLPSTLSIDSTASEDLSQRISSSVVRDSKTGKVFLKLVNVLPVPIEVSVACTDGIQLHADCPYEGFSGQQGQRRVKPVSGRCGSLDNGVLRLRLDPYALRVVEL